MKIEAVRRWSESDFFDPRERAAFAEAMTRTPAEVSDVVFDAARAQFTEEETVELICEIAMEKCRARFNPASGSLRKDSTQPR